MGKKRGIFLFCVRDLSGVRQRAEHLRSRDALALRRRRPMPTEGRCRR